ncbi:MAG: MgtC/SapB family protein [Candidatus Spechtbacterales bacterium]
MIQEFILTPYFPILLAFALGSVLGMQREYSGKPAGLRTYALVATGAALFTVISRAGFNEFLVDPSRFDPSRIASNIVTGIGFLGAGVILVKGAKVQGLTTAAGLWVAAAIGMATGVKMYGLAIFTTILVYVALELFGKVSFDKKDKKRKVIADDE